MRRRAFNQGGSISRWLAPRRSYSEGLPVIQEAVPVSEAGLENRQQPVKAGAVEDTVRQQTSLEQENGAIKTQKSRAQRPLPLSPLMDPAYLAAKQKYKLPKAAPSKELTPFQQQLAKNTYARALATPVRMCATTSTQLPSFFLQDFELIGRPSTNDPWYLPRSLTSAHSSSPIPAESPSSDSLQPLSIRRGPRFYVLCRASLLSAMGIQKSGYTFSNGRFASQQHKKFKAFREMKTRWRSDMDVFALDLMRRRIVEGLKYLCGRKVGYLQGCPDWDHVKGSKQVGAFLWLGQKNEGMFAAVHEAGSPATGEGSPVTGEGRDMAADQVEEKAVGRCEDMAASQQARAAQDGNSGVAPREFATLDMDKEMKSKVPVHNLRLLLGNDLVEDLRRHTPNIFKQEMVALKHRRATIDVQLGLWKLQGYLAEHK